MADCKHEWEQYLDLPGGEEPFRYWKCSKCGVLGYRTHHGHGGRVIRNTRLLKCRKCGGRATTRRKGRLSTGRIQWLCEEHAQQSSSAMGDLEAVG